jgi:hypothetical protein
LNYHQVSLLRSDTEALSDNQTNFKFSMVVKGHRRDTSWYSIIDDEWNTNVKKAFEAWLSDDNFDEKGQQIKKLEEFRK